MLFHGSILSNNGASTKLGAIHKEIAEWCDRFWCQYLDVDAEEEIEQLLPVLTDVETQWDLYLANKYSVEDLRSGSFDDERMPAEWFVEWLDQIRK